MSDSEPKERAENTKFNPSRRGFGKAVLGAALGGTRFPAPAGTGSRAIHQNVPGIKISVQSPPNPTDEDLLFLKQLGAEYVSVAAPPELRTAEGFLQIKRHYESTGITVWNIGNMSVHNMPEVTLNLPGRDAKIEEYKNYLRNLSKTGIYYTTYAHMGNGIWSSGRGSSRGAAAREFDQASPNKVGVWGDAKFYEPLSHRRQFTIQEIWDNYTYFIKQVVPVAESEGVRIGIHPDDTAVPVLAGVPRCVFDRKLSYQRV